jgi:hypothetical protein
VRAPAESGRLRGRFYPSTARLRPPEGAASTPGLGAQPYFFAGAVVVVEGTVPVKVPFGPGLTV